jgi:hypothetical protein
MTRINRTKQRIQRTSTISDSGNAAFIRAFGYVALVGWTVFVMSPDLSQWVPKEVVQVKSLSYNNVSLPISQPDSAASALGTGIPQHKLPDWRMAVDCSVFDFHCFSIRQSQGLYKDYPFPYTRASAHDENEFDWEVLTEIPKDWKDDLHFQSLDEPPPRKIEYIYPPKASPEEYQTCLAFAQTQTWQDQLDELLAHKISPDNVTHMVAFTISDYNYAFDMMHDFFEMNNRIVGYSNATFMVAIDYETMELACRYNYPVLAWPSALQRDSNSNSTSMSSSSDTEEPAINAADQNEELKAAVANTKFEVSYALVKRNTSFFFYEMDVWFLKSPKSIIQQFTGDILFSSHQNCPKCFNIVRIYLVYWTKAAVSDISIFSHTCFLFPTTIRREPTVWWQTQKRQNISKPVLHWPRSATIHTINGSWRESLPWAWIPRVSPMEYTGILFQITFLGCGRP